VSRLSWIEVGIGLVVGFDFVFVDLVVVERWFVLLFLVVVFFDERWVGDGRQGRFGAWLWSALSGRRMALACWRERRRRAVAFGRGPLLAAGP
jgi:hypothetical protein